MEEIKPLLEEDYEKLPAGIGWSFSEFGGVTLDLVVAKCKELNLSICDSGKVVSAWRRHPKNLYDSSRLQKRKK
jgi:hypothetical protein